jgi:DNA-binding HxlR family transcriptional regulator
MDLLIRVGPNGRLQGDNDGETDDRSLTADGLVDRRVEASVPPRVHYRLTDLGRSLDEPLAALREWAERHMPDIDDFAQRPA